MHTASPIRRRIRRTSQGPCTLGQSLLGLTALALLTGVTAKPAAAQYLLVGTNNPLAGGTATISGSGTTASGTFQFLDSNTQPAPLPPGTTSYYEVNDVGPSTLTLNTGGSTSFLNTYNGGTADILGGSVGLLANDMNSTVNMSGGSVDHLDNSNGSIANINGGSINELNVGVGSLNGGSANVNGGTIDAVNTSDSGVANLFGGALGGLSTNGTSTINLFGTGFTEIPQGGNNFLINGVLQNGTVLVSLQYTDYNPGQDHLNFSAPVPETPTAASLGLLLALGAGGLAVARRRTPPAR